MRSGSDVNKLPTPCTYREDTGRKEQGRAFLDESSAPLVPNKDGPTIMAATTLASDEDDGTYKTPSK
jgi:hypothetical protein